MSVLSNITISQTTALGLATIGRFDFFVDSLDFKLKAYDESNLLVSQLTEILDLDAYPFTPVIPLNWEGPPMSVQDALDELALRTKIIENKEINSTEIAFTTIQDFINLYGETAGVITVGSIVHTIDSTGLDATGYTFFIPQGVTASFRGFDQNVNSIFSTEDNVSLFNAESDLFLSSLKITVTGANSQAILMNSQTAFEALDMQYVDLSGCTKLGTLNGIRQGFWAEGFCFGAGDGFTLDGAVSGGFTLFSSRIINVTGSVIGAGPSLVLGSMAGIRSNVNCTVQSGSTIFDFDYQNFTSDGSYQLDGVRISGGGTMCSDFTNGDFIGVASQSRKSFFSGNSGENAQNTSVGCQMEWIAEVVTPLTINVEAKALGTTTILNNTHFSQSQNNRIKYGSNRKIRANISIQSRIKGTANDDISYIIKKYDGLTTTTTTVKEQINKVDNIVGSVDIADFVILVIPVEFNTDQDYIEIFLKNNSGSDDVTVLNPSVVNVQAI